MLSCLVLEEVKCLGVLKEKFKEVIYSVLPITVIVLLLNFTLTPIESSMLIKFVIGSVFIVIGLSIFLFGVDIGIIPVGNLLGSKIIKTNKLLIVVVFGLILGFFISIAEPGLQVLAQQVEFITSASISKISILIVVSAGMGLLLSLGMVRIAYNVSLVKSLTVIYLIIFFFAIFAPFEFLAIAFDASGAVTGALTVPFILALAAGTSALKKDSKASERDSFGLVGITATGVVMTVLIMSIFSNTEQLAGVPDSGTSNAFLNIFLNTAIEIIFALLPLLVVFLIFQKFSLKLSKKSFSKIIKGFIYTYIGLVLFLVGVNAGFMDVGSTIGHSLASMDNIFLPTIIGFVVGLVTILAEPSVYVLTHQIEEITSGYIKRRVVLVALSIGVGLAVALSIVRILVPSVQFWHYLLPGYLISVVLSYIVPDLFVGIAFDSGTVASGPMTATFIFAFAKGAADAASNIGSNILLDGFGTIATVTLIPIIALQVLGLIFKFKSAKED